MTKAHLVTATESGQAGRDTAQIAALVRMTGPESYDYIFGGRPTLDRFLRRAWPQTGNLYAHDAATLALDGDALAGIEIGYPGAEFYQRRAALDAVARSLAADREETRDTLAALARRAEKTSYLNAHVPGDVYYLMALAVPPECRGQGIGKRLLAAAIGRAQAAGFRALHLDVLSNNPAVGLYRTMGLECAAEIVAPEPCRQHGIPMEMRMTIDL